MESGGNHTHSILLKSAAAVLLLLAAALFCGAAAADVTDNGNVAKIVETGTEYATVGEAINAASAGQTVQMIADSREETIFVGSEKTVTLDLHGYVLSNIKREVDSTHGSVLLIMSGELTLQDTCSPAPVHYFKITNYNRTELLELWVLDPLKTEDGTDSCIAIDEIDSYNGEHGWAKKGSDGKYVYKYVKVTGGCITGGSGIISDDSIRGGGVFIGNRGVFTMNGGNIVGNGCLFEQEMDWPYLAGGGIYLDDSDLSTVTINGGCIAGNNAQYGGGIYSFGETIDITGGKIIGNTAGCSGGGIMTLGSCTMTRGEIIGNTGYKMDDSPSSTMLMGAGAGVTFAYSLGTFTMSGGKIAGNFAITGGVLRGCCPSPRCIQSIQVLGACR